MITIKELLNQFDLHVELPDHILNLEFYGNYKNYSKIIDDSESPTEIFHQFIDEEKGYVISFSEPEGEVRSLEFWDGWAPDIDYDSEWEESYSYDNEEIPPHYINN